MLHFAAGTYYGLRERPQTGDLVLAADAGYLACRQAGITPDVMCLSKGLTGGYMPMSLTVTNQEIYDAFYDDYGKHKAFLHSHTYAGNPLGCAAAHGVLDVLEQDSILPPGPENRPVADGRNGSPVREPSPWWGKSAISG